MPRRTVEDTPERAAFREGFRGWLRDTLEPGWVEAIEAGDDVAFEDSMQRAQGHGWNPFSWMATIGASAYAAPLWPREHGGLSGEAWMQEVVREELARHRLPSFGANILGVGLAGPTIIAHGTDAQKERHLRRILRGDELWCQLFSEPGSGSDLSSLATRAVRDGDEWVVDGQKVWTTIAQFAGFGMLLARTDPGVPKHEGLTYFICDMRAPGVDVRPLRQMTGSAEFNEVFLTGVRIPDTDRVGDVGDGWRCARTTLANERATIAGISLDMRSVMGGARGDPWQELLAGVVGRDAPVVRQRLAQLHIDQEVREFTRLRAAAARLRGDVPASVAERSPASVAERSPGPEGSGSKLVNAELNQRRSVFAVDAAGMAGVAWRRGDDTADSRARAFLRARANTIEGGTSEVLRSQLAERVLGLPREPDVDKGAAWSEIRRN